MSGLEPLHRPDLTLHTRIGPACLDWALCSFIWPPRAGIGWILHWIHLALHTKPVLPTSRSVRQDQGPVPPLPTPLHKDQASCCPCMPNLVHRAWLAGLPTGWVHGELPRLDGMALGVGSSPWVVAEYPCIKLKRNIFSPCVVKGCWRWFLFYHIW